MKKTLSLLLAILMLATLAVSTAAAHPLLEMLNEVDTHHHNVYYTSWIDVCPECGKSVARFDIKDGKVLYQCFSPKCAGSGEADYKLPVVPEEKETEIVIPGTGIHDERCPSCCISRKSVYLNTVVMDGKLMDEYYCAGCCSLYYVEAAASKPSDITCKTKDCKKTATFCGYTMENGMICAKFKCADGHVSLKVLYPYSEDEDYRIRVYCDHGEYDVRGGSYAKYGETKTVYFEADDGYVLADVTLNGTSVNVTDNKLVFTVKGSTTICAFFEKKTAQQTVGKTCTVTASAIGGGKITAEKNGAKVSADKVTAKYGDKIVYRFTPSSSRYSVADVKVDGKSKGVGTSLTLSKLTTNHKIEVTFKWNNPYSDLNASYAKAVEYVTEAGIMGALKTAKTNGKTTYSFCGSTKVTVKQFAAALAEMADTKGKLNTADARVEWAKDNGIVGKDQDLTAVCDVQTACTLVKNYLTAVEKLNRIDFTAVKAKDTAKETAVKIGMVTTKTYDKNRDLNRYDLASICKLISGLDF